MKVLVALDGSEISFEALKQALQISSKARDEVVVVHVIESAHLPGVRPQILLLL